MTYIKIKEVEIYHPTNVVENTVFFKHFQKTDKEGNDYSHFIEDVLGRKERFIIDNDNENSLTMALNASRKVLEKANLKGKDLDMIIFSSQTPEYTATSNAIRLHHELEAANKTITMDSNANCAGMTVAVEQASRYMLSNPYVNTVLVVGSDFNSLMSNPEEPITYANFGDAACAVILEKTEEQTGFIDSIYYTDSVNFDKTDFPRTGLSKLIRGEKQNQSMIWIPFDGDAAMPPTYEMFENMLSRNNMSIQDVNAFCLSQFSISNIKVIQKHYGLKDSQMMYAGDRFGYTGTTSPFLAFYDGIQKGNIKRGDNVLFWTIGAGFQLVAVLFKY